MNFKRTALFVFHDPRGLIEEIRHICGCLLEAFTLYFHSKTFQATDINISDLVRGSPDFYRQLLIFMKKMLLSRAPGSSDLIFSSKEKEKLNFYGPTTAMNALEAIYLLIFKTNQNSIPDAAFYWLDNVIKHGCTWIQRNNSQLHVQPLPTWSLWSFFYFLVPAQQVRCHPCKFLSECITKHALFCILSNQKSNLNLGPTENRWYQFRMPYIIFEEGVCFLIEAEQ